MNSTAKVRFALIGAGVIGDVHARALTQLDIADLVAIADLDESKAANVAQDTVSRKLRSTSRTCCDAATSMR